MVPGLKILCTSHQAKIAICCQMPLVAQIAPKICTGWFSIMLNPKLQSHLLSDHSRHTSFKKIRAPSSHSYSTGDLL